MRETRVLEFKETITNTFLKTVSAFSNYDGGAILFGVDDDGNVKGLNPVTRSVPGGKPYNRKKDKQERRRIGREFSDGFDADFYWFNI